MLGPIQRQRTFWDAVCRGEHPDYAWLEQRFGVAHVTAKRDVRALKDGGAPLAFDPAVGGFRRTATDWTLPAPGDELRADGALGVVAGAAARGLVHAWNPELGACLTGRGAADFDRAVLVTTSHGAIVDVALLQALTAAIAGRRRVRFRYQSPWQGTEPAQAERGSAISADREVSPWLLHIDDGHTYLRGFCHERDEQRAFHLAGIAGLSVLETQAKTAPRDLRKRVLGRIGVGGDIASDTVAVVRLRGTWARWVERERWHLAQRDRWDGETLERKFHYGMEIEVVRRLLPGGADVEVVSPASLKAAYAAEVRRAAAALGH